MDTAIYARYSAGPRQTDQSIEGQLRVCHSFCKEKGLRVIGEYCDRHISGKTDERPEFQRLIADAKSKKFEAVVVYKTDRFARNKYDSAIYKQELKKNGIKIYYAAEAIPDGPEGIILETLMEGLAEYYSVELAQKIRRGMNESALKCQSTGSGKPLGYKVDEQKRFQIDPEGAKAVQDIFDMYIKGVPCADICRYLNDRGFRTVQKRPFNKSSVNRIIQNRKYTGVYIWHDIEIPGGMPRIISDDTFALAQHELTKRRVKKQPRAPRAEYLLAGKLFCGHCKDPMHGVSGTGKSGDHYYYYYCRNTRGPIKTCDKAKVSRDQIEKEVAEFTVNYVLQDDIIEKITDKLFTFISAQNGSDDLAVYEKKLAENKKAIANIMTLIETGPVTKSLPERLQKLEEEQEAITTEILYLKNKAPALDKDQLAFALRQYGEMLPGEDIQAYHKRIITCFVSEVYVYDDKLLIFFNITGEDGTLLSKDLSFIESEVFDQRSISSTKWTLDEHRIF